MSGETFCGLWINHTMILFTMPSASHHPNFPSEFGDCSERRDGMAGQLTPAPKYGFAASFLSPTPQKHSVCHFLDPDGVCDKTQILSLTPSILGLSLQLRPHLFINGLSWPLMVASLRFSPQPFFLSTPEILTAKFYSQFVVQPVPPLGHNLCAEPKETLPRKFHLDDTDLFLQLIIQSQLRSIYCPNNAKVSLEVLVLSLSQTILLPQLSRIHRFRIQNITQLALIVFAFLETSQARPPSSTFFFY